MIQHLTQIFSQESKKLLVQSTFLIGAGFLIKRFFEKKSQLDIPTLPSPKPLASQSNQYTGRLIISFKGEVLPNAIKPILAHSMVFGVILFENNFSPRDTEKLKQLIIDIQAAAQRDMPVFVDHEGGYIQRFQRGFTSIPAAKVFGTTYDINPFVGLNLAKHYGSVMAKELMDFGIISLAPVLDLDAGNVIIGGTSRAFHKDPSICTELARSFITGMQSQNMEATAKHFPGHGQNIGDSHSEKPVDNRSLQELMESDLLPFNRLIKAGKIAALMPAHILYPKIDPDNIAGMSTIWLQNILKDQLGFNGITLSDCLSMAGAGNSPLYERIKTTLDHLDIAIVAHQEPKQYSEILNQLGQSYQLSEDQVQRAKKWVGSSAETRKSLSKGLDL